MDETSGRATEEDPHGNSYIMYTSLFLISCVVETLKRFCMCSPAG